MQITHFIRHSFSQALIISTYQYTWKSLSSDASSRALRRRLNRGENSLKPYCSTLDSPETFRKRQKSEQTVYLKRHLFKIFPILTLVIDFGKRCHLMSQTFGAESVNLLNTLLCSAVMLPNQTFIPSQNALYDQPIKASGL